MQWKSRAEIRLPMPLHHPSGSCWMLDIKWPITLSSCLEELEHKPQPRADFPPTRWSIVLKANDGTSPEAREALEHLCRNYWFPLYAFARRRGLDPHDAEDATQMFFVKLLKLESLKTADPERGRLRSFLLAAMSRFLAQKWRNEHTLKRGGGETIISIDVDQAEQRLAEATGDGGEAADFDREWAYALIARVFERLRLFHEARGRAAVFEALKGCLLGDGDYGDEAALAAELGVSGAGVRSAVFQMRQRFRRYVEEEIRDTVDSEADLRDELAHLCRALANHRG